MERITKRIGKTHACYAICEKECPDGIYNDNPACMCTASKMAMKRLLEYEDTGLTPPEIMELKERDTAKAAIITGYNCAIGCKVGECPTCGAMTRDYLEFCSECGQRIKWED